jgi:hypothetical protein
MQIEHSDYYDEGGKEGGRERRREAEERGEGCKPYCKANPALERLAIDQC